MRPAQTGAVEVTQRRHSFERGLKSDRPVRILVPVLVPSFLHFCQYVGAGTFSQFTVLLVSSRSTASPWPSNEGGALIPRAT